MISSHKYLKLWLGLWKLTLTALGIIIPLKMKKKGIDIQHGFEWFLKEQWQTKRYSRWQNRKDKQIRLNYLRREIYWELLSAYITVWDNYNKRYITTFMQKCSSYPQWNEGKEVKLETLCLKKLTFRFSI